MEGVAQPLVIRSRQGAWWDLLPIYSLYQLVFNLTGLALILWLWGSFAFSQPILLGAVLLAWVQQYRLRPALLDISRAQADRLAALLDAQGRYARSDHDGRWRATGKQGWEPWPHQHIEFLPRPDGVTVAAPHNILHRLWDDLALLEERGLAAVAQQRKSEADLAAPQLPWTVHGPTALIGAMCVAAWLVHLPEGMSRWGVSGLALAQGRYATILLHMFAHGGLMHLWLNMVLLSMFGGTLVARLGLVPQSWLRFLALFLCSGVMGAALYLLAHPAGTVPMIGASGALYGVIGLVVRLPAEGDALQPLRSRRMLRIYWSLIKDNLFLIVLLGVMFLGSGSKVGLAWEAHLGGFLFGLLVGPFFLPSTAERAAPRS
ncbi:rhomboid family intramembrane serine protease [Sphingomonas sp. ASY06-1R]|uniref:rhomboid family intramembrane serine protease n=1 Tax=Sphingomonas sp. ASY06-1R TaxID=3445771 RepID=UPI003FA254A2